MCCNGRCCTRTASPYPLQSKTCLSLPRADLFAGVFIPLWWACVLSAFYSERFEADDLARRLLMLGAATASVRRRRELQPLVMCFEMPARHEQACDSIADRRAELFVDPERTCNSIFGNVTAAIIASRATAARMRSSRRARRRWRGSGPAGGPVLVSVLK